MAQITSNGANNFNEAKNINGADSINGKIVKNKVKIFRSFSTNSKTEERQYVIYFEFSADGYVL